MLQTGSHQFKVLEQFYPEAQRHDWSETVAGQRVQIIKPDPERTGVHEFGTEEIGSADNSIVALLGASPGASTAAFIAFQVLEKCFEKELAGGWRDKLKTMIPTYGIDLTQDAAATRDTRAKTAAELETVMDKARFVSAFFREIGPRYDAENTFAHASIKPFKESRLGRSSTSTATTCPRRTSSANGAPARSGCLSGPR